MNDLYQELVQTGVRALRSRGLWPTWEHGVAPPSAGALAEESSSFTDAGDAPLTWLDTALQRSPATLSNRDVPSDLRSNLCDVKPRSEGIASQ